MFNVEEDLIFIKFYSKSFAFNILIKFLAIKFTSQWSDVKRKMCSVIPGQMIEWKWHKVHSDFIHYSSRMPGPQPLSASYLKLI